MKIPSDLFDWFGIALCVWALAWCTSHEDDIRHDKWKIEHAMIPPQESLNDDE